MTTATNEAKQSRLPAGCLPLLVFFGLLALALSVQLGRLALFLSGTTTPFAPSLVVTALLAVGPLWFLQRHFPEGRTRAAFTAWLLALPFALFMWPIQLPEADEAQLAQIIRVIMSLIYLGFLLFLFRRQGRSIPRPDWGQVPIALVLSTIIALPWLILGALGSPLDTVLDLIAGLLFGLSAALILSLTWFLAIKSSPENFWVNALSGSVVAWLMLLIMVTAFGFNGSTRPLVILVPWMGWLVAAYTTATPRPEAQWPATTLFLGLGTSFILMFSDTDMLALINLAPGRETILYTLLAAFLSTLPIGILFVVLGALRHPLRSPKARWPVLAGASVFWVLGGIAYVALGQPGFHGDRLFVVLKEQAEVSNASQITNYDERRTFVYDTLVEHAEQSQRGLRRLLDGLRVDYTPYYLVNGLEVQGGSVLRLVLSLHPDVDRVMTSPVLRPLPGVSPPARGTEIALSTPTWNQDMIRAPEVWETFGVRGEGIIIGQSDSGVEWTHSELQDSYRGGQIAGALTHDYNWLDPWNGDLEPTDTNGHGTHTLGLALGNQLGVAPDASWIGCKNLDRNLANPALYLDCMQFMLAPFPLGGDPFLDGNPTRAAHVLNNSWGCPVDTEGCDVDVFRPAVDALRAAGIFVVVSAGNDGPPCSSLDTPPAIYEAVYSVGAVDATGRVTAFSSMGPVLTDGSGRVKPDIVAPGDQVLSAYPGNTYFTGSGTSQAGPHVAGVVALLWSANPDLIGDIDRTEEILRSTAAPYQPVPPETAGTLDLEDTLLSLGKEGDCRLEVDTNAVPNVVSGYGLVDAFAAVQLALTSE